MRGSLSRVRGSRELTSENVENAYSWRLGGESEVYSSASLQLRVLLLEGVRRGGGFGRRDWPWDYVIAADTGREEGGTSKGCEDAAGDEARGEEYLRQVRVHEEARAAGIAFLKNSNKREK